ncbi:MAG TPA: Gfo/Idh/MocA family oxidoreductase [Micromonosporaceae bacterium]
MPDEPRLGLIGCGSHARMAILPALRFSRLHLVAVCDLDMTLAEQTARLFGASACYRDYHAMLAAEDLDVVAVIGPPALHHAAGLAVLASGRHLFVEKPPARSYALAAELAAAAGDRQVMVGFQKRHARAYRMARAVASSASFGAPSMLRIGYSHVRTPGLREHLLDMSIHALDLARSFLGDVASGAVHLSARDDHHVIALTLEHTGGAVSMLSLSALEPRLQETVELAGDSTLLRVRDLSELTVERAAPEWEDCYDTGPDIATMWRPDFAIPTDDNNSLVLQGYAGELVELADAITTGRTVNGNIDDALAALALVEAIARAPLGFSMLDLRHG